MTRIAMLIKADAHGMMDQLEERSLLLKQNLREAELELGRKRARCEAIDGEVRRLRDELGRVESAMKALDEDVALALTGEKDELARFAVRRLLPKRRRARELRARIAEFVEARERLGERIEAQETEFEELSQRVREALVAERAQAEAPAYAEPMVADEEIELELLRRRESVSLGTS